MDVARRMKPRHIMGVDIDPALIHKVWQRIRALLACDIVLRMRTARLSRACIVNGVTDTIERCVARLDTDKRPASICARLPCPRTARSSGVTQALPGVGKR